MGSEMCIRDRNQSLLMLFFLDYVVVVVAGQLMSVEAVSLDGYRSNSSSFLGIVDRVCGERCLMSRMGL